jgi:peptide/nickel transport system permease protein
MTDAVQADVAKTRATAAPRTQTLASTSAAVVLTPAEAVVDKAPPGLLRRLPTSRVALAGAVIVALWASLGFLAPWLPLQPPNAQDFMAMADPLPSAQHWLGADTLGRDILSRLIWGARTVLIVAPVAVLAAYVVGCAVGLLSGYYGSYVDAVISRGSDVILSFPVVVLYVILIANIGPSALNIVVAVVLASSPGVGRIVRGLVLELKEQDFVAAARLRRESDLYIMLVELLPNCRGPLITDFCLRLGYTTITIGTLGFLGLGLPPPTADWGGMVQQATAMITVYPHMALFPCLAIVSLVLGFNLLADGLRELSLSD